MNRFTCLGVALMLSLPAAAWAAPPVDQAGTSATDSTATPATTAPSGPGKAARASRRGLAATPDISCPGDAVVWVNPRSKAYHMQGDSFFGRTKHGSFMCKKAADSAGDHPVKSK